VVAYAFLARGAVEPLSGFAWPTPAETRRGAWVNADSVPREALRGYPSGDLPYWLDDELWRIELVGKLAERDHLLLAERARLAGRIDAWADPVAWEFVAACARRIAVPAAVALREEGRAHAAARLEGAGDLGELEQAAAAAADLRGSRAQLAGYLADVCFYSRDAGIPARAAGVAAKMSAHALAADAADARAHDAVLARERAWQAGWLVERLGLSAH
jgi:hypothetical protein